MALVLTCPICGKRDGYEFRYGGEDKETPPVEKEVTPRSWCDHVHMNTCKAGIQKEWWCHVQGCGLWFTTARDTVTNLEMKKAEALE